MLFNFRIVKNVAHDLDPMEYQGLDYGDTRAAILDAIGEVGVVDDDDLDWAANAIRYALARQ